MTALKAKALVSSTLTINCDLFFFAYITGGITTMTKGNNDTMFERIVNYICDGDKTDKILSRVLRRLVTVETLSKLAN